MLQFFNPKIIIPILKKNGAMFAGIFGSYAKGRAKKNSDIDILIKFKKNPSLIQLIQLEDELSRRLRKKVDLVTEEALSPYIKTEVLNTLQLFYGKR